MKVDAANDNGEFNALDFNALDGYDFNKVKHETDELTQLFDSMNIIG